MLQKSRRLDIVGVIQHEFRVLRRGADVVFAQFLPPQRPIDQRHGNRLALGLAKDKAIASRELRGFGFRTLELIDGFAFGQGHFADLNSETQFGDVHLDRYGADAQLADKGMIARITALRGIGHRQGETFVRPGQSLQPQRAVGRHFQRLARQVGGRCIVVRCFLDQALAVQKSGNMRHSFGSGLCLRRLGHLALGGEFEI